MKKLLMIILFSMSTMNAPSAHAMGEPVIDITAIIQFITKSIKDASHQLSHLTEMAREEVADTVAQVKRIEEVQQLITTYDQIVEAYDAVTKLRDTAGGAVSSAVGMVDGSTMMDYVEYEQDNDGNWKVKTDDDGNVIKKSGMAYLPDSYEDGLRRVVNKGGNSSFLDEYAKPIRDYLEKLEGFNTDDRVEINQAQAIYNRSLAALAYQQASQRNAKIKEIQQKFKDNGAEDKDVQDFMANAETYNAFLQNDQLKLQSLILLQQAQMNVEQQRAKQRRAEMMKVTITPGTLVAAGSVWVFDKE